jgi:muramoyltetrapeptide carboxypeptidase
MKSQLIIPPFLNPGDRISIAATARFTDDEKLSLAVKCIQNAGFEAHLPKGLNERKNQFAGDDSHRATLLNSLIRDEKTRAILCFRGGYGTGRILNAIDYKAWIRNPKWIIGYSDLTCLQNYLIEQLNMASIHGTMPVDFQEVDEPNFNQVIQLLKGSELDYEAAWHKLNRTGVATGPLIGGNLSVIYSMMGSDTQLNTNGAVLFLEDLDEYLYHIDRMMLSLERGGLLSKLSGLIVGGMSSMNDNTIPFGYEAEEIIHHYVDKYNYPVCFNFPSGHQRKNSPWVQGKKIRLIVNDNQPSKIFYV